MEPQVVTPTEASDTGETAVLDWARPLPIPDRLPLPTLRASGLYEYRSLIMKPPPSVPIPKRIPIPIPEPDPGPIGPAPKPSVGNGAAAGWTPFPVLKSEEVRLDVDGRYPQMTVSGTNKALLANVHWIAGLTPTGPWTYTGSIWFKDGAVASFPYTNVAVVAVPSYFPSQQWVTITFTGGGAPPRVRSYAYKTAAFHTVDFEFDSAEGEAPTISFDTGSHPVRPATLPVETLTVQKVFQRAGFAVTTSPGGSVPLAGAGANATWSDMEMHDAMQTYWSHFAPQAQWALWVFFASLHDMGTGLGGIMFDDIGAQHRQGTAIFNDSFIAQLPPGDPHGAAFVQRMLFWTACHEMGHAFNLAHSWQKALVDNGRGPWIPIPNEPEARSFMNYPYNVSGGSTAFFSDFEYRFTDQELLFLRHAPARFVRMGDAIWFDHHGFEGANTLPAPTFELALRVNRETPHFEFLEVVTAELKLTNTSGRPQIIDAATLALDGDMTVVIKKGREPARQLLPLARYCRAPQPKVLMPGESIYAPLVLSVGGNGWDIASPGTYDVHVALELPTGEDILSNGLRLRVTPPRGYDEEYLADDYFSDEVGRTLAFGGTEYFDGAKATLQEVAQRLPDRRAAVHAKLALARPLTINYKQLGGPDMAQAPTRINVRPAQPDEAQKLLTDAVTAHPEQAVETLGHICFKETVDQLSSWLAKEGDTEEASRQQQVLLETLSNRVVRGRPVLPSVLAEVQATLEHYKG